MTQKKKQFGLLGAAGYIAPRHFEAIHATGNELVVACDPCDSVGILDRYSLDTAFMRSEADFASFLRDRNRGPSARAIDFISICTPNHLHLDHCRLALSEHTHVICEKPLALTPRALDELRTLELRSERRIFTILQLRVHERLVALRQRLLAQSRRSHDVVLTYLTGRGPWYHASWKGDPQQSGGIATNIGIHLFDLLIWLFGAAQRERVYVSDARRMSGVLELERARVRWFLSVDPGDVARAGVARGFAHREMRVDGECIDFSDGFAGLHTRVYEAILAGSGLGIEDARASVELTLRLKSRALSPIDEETHPLVRR